MRNRVMTIIRDCRSAGAALVLALVGIASSADAAVPPLEPVSPAGTHLSMGAFGSLLLDEDLGHATGVLGSVVPFVGRSDDGAGVLRGLDLGLLQALDRHEPASTLLSPLQCDNYSSAMDIVVLASAEDDGAERGIGVRGIEISLQDNDDSRYWDGGAWASGERWISLSPTATPGTYELPAAVIQAWPIWVPGKAFRITSRALDWSGNRERALPSRSVLFQFDSVRPVTQIDFPVASSVYSSLAGNPVDRVEGRACEEASAPITDVLVRMQVTASTAAPADNSRFGHYWNGTSWVPEESWVPVDSLMTPAWLLGTAGVDFDCPASAPSTCGQGITATSAPITSPGPPDERDGSSIVFYYDAVAPFAMQLLPPDASKQSAVSAISGLAKDCGNTAPAMPPAADVQVDLQIVRQVWNAGAGRFEDGAQSWTGSTWSSADNWVSTAQPIPLVPFEPCPAEGWSYSWQRNDSLLATWLDTAGHGLRFRIRTRVQDEAGNTSWSLGDTFHFDDVAPNPPSADAGVPGPVAAVAPGGAPAILHDTWQNVSPQPVFSWAEPWDACDPALVSCDLNDPDRESSGIARYHLAWSTSPTATASAEQDPSDRDFVAPLLATEGIFVFRTWAEDEAGNVSLASDFVVKHEVTPPLVTAVTAPPLDHRLYMTSVPRIEGTATDPGAVRSGIAAVQVRLHQRAVDLATGMPTGPITYWDGSSWIAAETWVDAGLTDLGGGDWTWALDMPDSPHAWSFEHQYTARIRAVDHAGNVTPDTEWALGRFRISRPYVSDAVVSTDRHAPWNESYQPGAHVTNPLDEPITIALEFTESVLLAETPLGVDIDPSRYAEFDLGTNPPRTIISTLLPGETKRLGVSRSHYWRWLGPSEDSFYLECDLTGMLGLLPGPNLGKLAKIKQLKKFKRALDAGDNAAEGYDALALLTDVFVPIADSMPRAEFEHRISSVSPGAGIAAIDVWRLSDVERRIKVKVPKTKERELVVSSSLTIAAEITSLIADLDPELISKGILLAAEAGEIVASCHYARSAADPDPNFAVHVQPLYWQVEDVTADPVMLADNAARLYLQTELDLVSNRTAMFAARNKYWGAAEAGDDDWIVRQSEATRFYAGLVRDGYRSKAGQFERVIGEIAAGNLDASNDELAGARQRFVAGGLPPLEQEILTFFGIPQTTIDKHAEAFAIEPVDPAELDGFYDLLREEFALMPESLRDFADTEISDYWIFLDQFDDGVLDGWTAIGPWAAPNMGEADQHAAASGDQASSSLLLSDASFRGSHRVMVDVVASEEPFSLLWHVQDDAHYGELLVMPGDPATIEAFIVEGGVRRSIIGPVTDALPARDWHVLQVELTDGHVQVYVDDEPSPDVPGAIIPRLWGEADDATFTSGRIGLATAGGDPRPTLFDNIRVITLADGERETAPEISVTPSPAAPLDTETVTFSVNAPAGATDVALFVDGRLVQSWTSGGVHEWTGGPFRLGCTVAYSARAIMADGSLVTPQLEENESLAVTDSTAPSVIATSASVAMEAQDCDGSTGWADYSPWLNVHVFDACDHAPALSPASGATQRFFMGTTSVPVSATDALGHVGSAEYEVVVFNTPPDVPAPAASTTNEGALLTLSAVASDPRTKSLMFRWDFGDGSPVVESYHGGLDPSSPVTITDVVEHAWGDDGAFIVTVSVEDDCGTVTSTKTNVVVANLPPSIASFGPFTGPEGSVLTLSAVATDPGSDDLTFTWSFDEPSLAGLTGVHLNDGAAPDLPMSGPGTFPFNPTDEQAVTFGDDGLINIQLTVTDDDGGSATVTSTLSVTNLPPIIEPFGPLFVNEGEPLAILAQVSDPGSDDLSFEWNFGHPVNPPASVLLLNDGASPDPPQSGPGTFPFVTSDEQVVLFGDDSTFPVVLVVTDDDGGSTTYETEIVVANVPPSIDPGSVSAGVAADLTLRLIGPAGAEVRMHPAPGPPVTEYVPGFEARVFLFTEGALVGSASMTEADFSGSGEASLSGLELALDAESTVRVEHSTRFDRATSAILELRFEDGRTRTVATVFPDPLGAPGHVQHPVPFDTAEVRTWRVALGDLLAGAGTSPGDPLELRATVRGLQAQLDEGLLELALDENGFVLAEQSLDIEQALRDGRRSGFPDLDGDRLPDDHVLTLAPATIDLGGGLLHEGRFRYGVGSELLHAGVARIGPVASGAGLDLAWADAEAAGRCRRPVRDFDCVVFEWSADLGALFAGTVLRVEASGSDPGSDDLEFSWNWGDGTPDDVATYWNDGVAADPRPSPESAPITVSDAQEHVFAGAGDYPITLTLRDDDGGVDQLELAVLLLSGNRAPVIDEASLVVSEIAEDPHGRGHAHVRNYIQVELASSDADGDVLDIAVDWGDGLIQHSTLRYDGDPADGAPFLALLSVRHDYEAGGVHPVRVTVTDESGGEDILEFLVTTVGN